MQLRKTSHGAANCDDLVREGIALDAQGKWKVARNLFQEAIEGSREATTQELVVIGLMLQARDEGPVATKAYSAAIAREDGEATLLAYLCYGLLREECGDRVGAAAAYDHVINSYYSSFSSDAGNLHARLEEEGGACPGGRAAFWVAEYLEDADDPKGAVAAYQRAISSGHPECRPPALLRVGILLRGANDRQGARAAFDRAIRTDDEEVRAKAGLNLAGLLCEEGDRNAARQAYESVLAGPADPTSIQMAGFSFALMLHGMEDWKGAMTAY